MEQRLPNIIINKKYSYDDLRNTIRDYEKWEKNQNIFQIFHYLLQMKYTSNPMKIFHFQLKIKKIIVQNLSMKS